MFSNKVILAIDAGGTSIKYALLDDDKLNTQLSQEHKASFSLIKVGKQDIK